MDRQPSSALKDFLTFPSILFFLYSKWRTVFMVFVIAASVSVALAFIRERTYSATATIVVLPPKFSTELNPEVLSVQTYEQYFHSHAIVDEVLRQVPELDEDYTVEELLDDLTIVTLREKYGTEVKFSPLIMLRAEAKDPLLAKKLADTWAKVASEKAKVLLSTGKEGVVKFINEQFADLRNQLIPAEEDLATTSTAFKDKILQTKNDWEQKIAIFKATNNIDRMKAEVEALNKLVAESEAELAGIDLKVEVAEQTLVKARERQKELQEKIKLERSITESEIWETLRAQQGEKTLGELSQLKLQNEEINPTYVETAKAAEAAEIELAGLQANRASLKKDLETRLKKADSINKEIAEKSKELLLLELTRDTEVAKLEIQQETALARATRVVDQYKKTNETLSTMAEEARMAQKEESDYIKIGSFAVVPKYPLPTSTRRFFILTATFFTTCAAVLILLLGKILSLVEFPTVSPTLSPRATREDDSTPAGSRR